MCLWAWRDCGGHWPGLHEGPLEAFWDLLLQLVAYEWWRVHDRRRASGRAPGHPALNARFAPQDATGLNSSTLGRRSRSIPRERASASERFLPCRSQITLSSHCLAR